MLYEEAAPITRAEAEKALASDNADEVCRTLVRITLNDPDWRWVQTQCLRFVEHPHVAVRGLAITCLGHLARIHGVLDVATVLPILEELRKDREVAGRVGDALDDISMFLGRPTSREGGETPKE